MGAVFAYADDHHPMDNKAKMRAGEPLTDKDRQPWLETLNGVLRDWQLSGAGGVLACSALKEDYRRALRAGLPEGTVRFVLLEGTKELIAERLARRQHEYMNPKLLTSQLATLEPPADALIVMNDRPPQDIVNEILRRVNQ
jgi:gluconokinase